MKFTLQVGRAEQYRDISENEERLRVPFTIVDEAGAVAAERIESFPLSTSETEVREVLQRHLTVFTEDFERYESIKAQQALRDGAQTIADNISGLTL
jgi:RecB family endonuclease NucS